MAVDNRCFDDIPANCRYGRKVPKRYQAIKIYKT